MDDARSMFKGLVHGNYKSLDECSLVWPPMLFVCMHGDGYLTEESEHVRNWLTELKIDIVKHIPRVCSEGDVLWDLFILPPTGAAFAAALTMDEFTFGEVGYRRVYASVRDIWDIKASRIPESARNGYLGYLRYCGMPREEWVGLHVELLGDDGTCVGQGVCKASQPEDYFHGDILGDSHVGIFITTSESLKAVDGSSAINRRWKITHVLFEDVSLSQRLDQYVKSKDPHESEQMEWMSARRSKLVPKSKINVALSSEECLKSLVPLVCGSEICDSLAGDSSFSEVRYKLHFQQLQELWVSQNYTYDVLALRIHTEIDEINCSAAAPWLEPVQVALRGIQKCEIEMERQEEFQDSEDSLIEELKDFQAESWEKVDEIEENITTKEISLMEALKAESRKEVENFQEDITTKEILMQQLWTMNGTYFGIGVLNRLKLLHKLIQPDIDTKSLSEMYVDTQRMKRGVGMAMKTLKSLQSQIDLQLSWKRRLNALNLKAEKSISQLRIHEQHKKLKQQLQKFRKTRMLILETFVKKKFKFVLEMRTAKEEFEKELRLIGENTPSATDQVKNMQGKEILKLEEHLKKADIQKKEMEGKLLEISAEREKVETELQAERMERAEADMTLEEISTKYACAICFNDFEEAGLIKKKRSRSVQQEDDAMPPRKRACFDPCMHATMCTECSVEAWTMYKRCPVCNRKTSKKPRPVFF